MFFVPLWFNLSRLRGNSRSAAIAVIGFAVDFEHKAEVANIAGHQLMKTKPRCAWVPEGKHDYADYHDTEWGVPVHQDQKLFEMLILEGAQAIPVLEHDPHMVQRATCLLWIAHELERAADHCTNICERIVFIVQGETDIEPSLEE